MAGKKIKIEKSAGAVLFRRKGGEILYLLLQYPQGHWSFARGHIEGNETSLETVRREVKEEVDISRIRFMPGFKERVHFQYRWPPKTKDAEARLKFVEFYLGQVFEPHVKISIEHKSYRWVSFERAYKMLKHRNMRAILQKANSVIGLNNTKFKKPRSARL